jgi:putative glutamine amidotransferase
VGVPDAPGERPMIGVTCDHDAGRRAYQSSKPYAAAIRRAGGVPLLLPFDGGAGDVPAYLDRVDGLLLTGGNDPDPTAWGEPWHPGCKPVDPTREAFERALILEARRRAMPTLGICLGMQLMAILADGGLIQFLPDEGIENLIEHRKFTDADWQRRHEVRAEPGSVLAEVTGGTTLIVNTNHRQSVRRTSLAISGHAPDGVVEAVEDPTLPYWLGVQWHPERLTDDAQQLALFERLIDFARTCRT